MNHVTIHTKYKSIDKVCDNIRNSVGLLGFKFIKYETPSATDKSKVEEAMLDMMAKFNITPLEILIEFTPNGNTQLRLRGR